MEWDLWLVGLDMAAQGRCECWCIGSHLRLMGLDVADRVEQHAELTGEGEVGLIVMVCVRVRVRSSAAALELAVDGLLQRNDRLGAARRAKTTHAA